MDVPRRAFLPSRCALIAGLVLALASGGAAARPAPSHAHTAQAAPPAPARITRERLSFQGADEPHTPAALNRVDAYRYAADAPAAGGPHPNTVLVLIPGLNSGPNTLHLLARTLVGRDPRLEVWIAQPRAGILQDRRGVTAALDYRVPAFTLGYYYGRLEIDGRQFTPLNPLAVPSAAYWGLDLHLRDIRVVIREVRRRYPNARIVLGGHSLGGMLAALYAGYDFGRAPGPAPAPGAGGIPAASSEAGANDIDGLVLIDGLPLQLPVRFGANRYLNGFSFPLLGNVPGVNALLATDPRGRVSPFTDTSAIARAKDSILFDTVAVYAYLRPDDPSVLPFYPRNGLRISNEALLGAVLSDRMQPDIFIRASVGAPLGLFDRVPDPAGVSPGGLLKLSSGRPLPGETLIRWIPYTRSTPPGLVDLRALEAAILQPDGDFTQWYFPWRLLLDLGLALSLDTSDPFSRRYASLTQIRYVNLPTLILGAGRGLIRSPGMADFYLRHTATPGSRVRVRIFPAYTHLDIEDAADNQAAAAILDWLPGIATP
jgi:Lipase (class 3)